MTDSNQGQDKKRTIYFAWNYPSWGGAQVYLLAIMKIARPTWDMLVILPRNSSPEFLGFLDKLAVPYEFFETSTDESPAITIRQKWKRQIRRIRSEAELYRHLKKFDLRNNVLHIDLPPWQSWITLTALSLRRANVFSTLHNFLSRAPLWREALWKARLQFVSRLPGYHIFASNKDTKQRMKGWVSEKFRESIHVTYTCVDPEQIDSVLAKASGINELRRRFGIPEDKFVVLSVGQFIDRKGRWIFLEAAEKIAAGRSDIAFVWLMPHLPNEEDSQRIAKYDLRGSFFPVLSRSVGSDRLDILSFFRIADAFALPSYIEGLPIALLEAMALGIPSISTNVYAIPEAVKDRETGLLIPAGNSDALKESILALREDAELRNRLSETGRDFVMKNFDEREAARIALAAYEECFRSGK